MKIAVVHDWLVVDAGAEKVLRGIIECYPDADIFSLVDFLSNEEQESILMDKYAHTSFIQNLPFAKKQFRNYLPLFPKAIESFDLSAYDLVISSSWAVAKGVKCTSEQVHISYCHTPIRYAWDLYDEYTCNLKQPKKFLVELTLKYIKNWDFATRDRVDYYIANSTFVKNRIANNYKREAKVIHPPVDTDAFKLQINKKEFYVTVSRLVPYKKVSMIVKAFNDNGKNLVVIGAGEEYEFIRSIAKDNITVMGWQERDVIIDYMQRAKAFVYAAEEDFGIVPVEAMACGTPVIAYGVGGVRDSVVENKTGIFFDKQTPESLNVAVNKFESLSFSAKIISQHAQQFSIQNFKDKLLKYIKQVSYA
ncbi:MAG: glycosyltransferase [Campylobacterota bacterium]|nr:glycosyltransferase [Campylobacterota bacterium]